MSKDILKDALEEVLSESYDEMTGLDIPDYDFSDNFKEKMEALTGVPEEKAEKKRRKIGWIAISALTAVAAAVCIWNGVQKTPELKKFNSDTDTIITDTELPTEVPDVPGGIVRTTAPGTDIKYTVTTTAGSETPITSTAVINGNGNNTVNGSGGSTYTRPSGKPAQTPKVTVTTARSSVPAAVTTTSAIKQPIITDVTTIPHSELDEQLANAERSIVMKKFLASAAAAATLMNAIPTGATAVYTAPQPDSFMLEYYFPALDAGEASPDVNNDGVFDRYDVCDLWAYIMHNDSMITEAEREVIGARSDTTLDGLTRASDLVVLEQYYLYKNGLNPDDFDMYNYPDNNGEITMDSYNFVDDLREVAIEQDLIYQYTANLIDTENIDLDFNRNGSADIYDLLEYQIYFYSKISSPFDSNAAKAVVSISASTWDNCDEYYQKCFFDNESNETLIKYFIYKNGFDPSYVYTWSIYDYLRDLEKNLPEGADVESIKYAMSRASHLDVFVGNVSKIAIDAGFLKVVDKMDKINRMFEPNYMEDLEAACKIFDKRMLNGEVAPPDINFDGVIDMEDYKDIMIYSDDLVAQRDSSGSVLTPEVWNHIDNELDLNSDGVSGDMLDLQIVEFVITKYYENEDVDVNALLKAYNDAHSTDNSNIEAVAEISHIKYLEALNGKPIKRSGDADGDNQMKMNDAVLIMQSISNPDTYELTEWGEFNADVANTGDGITPMDALGIQNRLLEK